MRLDRATPPVPRATESVPLGYNTDRRVKAHLYARHGIPEYWLVNLVERHVAVYRDPTPEGYHTVHIARLGEDLCPITFPDLTVGVDEILG